MYMKVKDRLVTLIFWGIYSGAARGRKLVPRETKRTPASAPKTIKRMPMRVGIRFEVISVIFLEERSGGVVVGGWGWGGRR